MNYEIVKMPDDRITLSMTMKAIDIVDSSMGEGYFANQLGRHSKGWIVVQGSFSKPEVIAYASIVKENDDCILKCAAVHPEHRGKGIGTELVKARLEYLGDQGCDVVKSYAWIINGKCPAEKPLKTNGFYFVEEVEAFYKNSNMPCLVCGDVCKCAAKIFEKKL